MKWLDRVRAWNIKRKIFVFYVLPFIIWGALGIIPVLLGLLGVPFKVLSYYSTALFSFPGILGIIGILYPALFANIYLDVYIPIYEELSKRASEIMHTKIESRLFFWDLGITKSRRALIWYIRLGSVIGIGFSIWVVRDILISISSFS
ncbi:MAG: hypothetical protein ABIH70_02450 [Chloroflexota bacterium]